MHIEKLINAHHVVQYASLYVKLRGYTRFANEASEIGLKFILLAKCIYPRDLTYSDVHYIT